MTLQLFKARGKSHGLIAINKLLSELDLGDAESLASFGAGPY